jgi:hypothetical protein
MHPECAFTDQDVWLDRWDLCDDQMPVFFPRVVARVQYLEASDLDHEHGCTQYMASMVRGETQAARDDDILVVIHGNGRLP